MLHQINLGEVIYRIGKVFGWAVAERKQAEIGLLPIETIVFSDEIFWAAVKLKTHYPMLSVYFCQYKIALINLNDPE